jgi:hypothetical protein
LEASEAWQRLLKPIVGNLTPFITFLRSSSDKQIDNDSITSSILSFKSKINDLSIQSNCQQMKDDPTLFFLKNRKRAPLRISTPKYLLIPHRGGNAGNWKAVGSDVSSSSNSVEFEELEPISAALQPLA